MIDRRASILISSIRRLFRRGALHNVQKILKKAHTADVATLIEQMDPEERLTIFKMISSLDQRADVLSYLEYNIQKDIVLSLDRKEANQLVANMRSDDAADLLGRLPEELSKEILDSLVKEDSEEVADLMSYPEDTAGGMMGSDYLALHHDLSIAEAIQKIQNQHEDNVTFYLYVVDDSNSLVGVLSLKEIILSKPAALLKEIMNPDVINVNVDQNAQEVARLVEKYDFLALPVVDSANKLMGVITVDDVIDVIREEAQGDFLAMGRAGWVDEASLWGHVRARLPWLALAFLGGLICFFVFEFILPLEKRESWWFLAGFIPLFLSMSSTAGQQSATVAVGAAKSGEFTFKGVTSHLLGEIQLGLLFSVTFSSLIFAISFLIFSNTSIATLLAMGLGAQILATVVFASIIPLTIAKLGFDPTILSVPLFMIIADISAVLVLFGFYVSFFGI